MRILRHVILCAALVVPGAFFALLARADSVPAFTPIEPSGAPAVGAGDGVVEGGDDAVAVTQLAKNWYFAEGHTGDGFLEYLTVFNPSVNDVADVRIDYTFLPGQGEPRSESLSVGPAGRSTVLVNEVVGNGKDVSVAVGVLAGPAVVVERTMLFRANAGLPDGAIASGGHVAPGATAPSSDWYFAEGYTGPGFVTYLTLQNPGDQATAATVDYLVETGQPFSTVVNMPAHSRVTLNAADVVGPGHSVSTEVHSPAPLVAERPMYFAFQPEGDLGLVDGGHVAVGATARATDWAFAEGYTGPGFDEYLTLQVVSPAHTTFTYAFSDGRPAVVRTLDLPVGRQTFFVNREAGVGEVSVQVHSDTPLVAERPMYFHADPGVGTVVNGGHVVLGTQASTGNLYLAEGDSRPGTVTYLTLADFSSSPLPVTIRAYYADATVPDSTQITLAPLSRRTLRVGQDVGRPGVPVALVVENPSHGLIVAERPMYFSVSPFPQPGSAPVTPLPPHGVYAFADQNNSQPVRWDPCTPIHYVVNSDEGPTNAAALVQAALDRVSAATGDTFINDGPTHTIAKRSYARDWNPIYKTPPPPLWIGWATQSESDVLNAQPGYGGSLYWPSPQGGYGVYRSGQVTIDSATVAQLGGSTGRGDTMSNLVLHYVTRAMGLAEVDATSEIMNRVIGASTPDGYGPGDRQGLSQLGSAAGCITLP